MSKHTPGPWILDYDKGTTQDILSRKHGGICTVRRAGIHDSKTFAANAALIAAAPDLLAALYHALAALDDAMKNHTHWIYADAQNEALAAIAKAEGRTP